MLVKHLIITFFLFSISVVLLPAQDLYKIQSRWKSNEYIQVEQTTPASTTIQPGWLSAQWTFEAVPGTGYCMIRNKWRNEFLHIQNGRLECGPVQPGWWSAQWAQEPVDGSSFIRIRSRWKPEVAINNQNGQLEAGPIQLGWWSAHWQLISTSGAAAPQQQSAAVPPSAGPSERNGDNPAAFSPEHRGTITQIVVRYTDQISLSDVSVGTRVYFFPQEVITSADGVSFDAKNPPICGQTFTVTEINPKVKFDRPMPMMRDRVNNSFRFVVELY